MPTFNVKDILFMVLLFAILGAILASLGVFEALPAYFESMIARFELQWSSLYGKIFSAIPSQMWFYLAFVPVVGAVIGMIKAV